MGSGNAIKVLQAAVLLLVVCGGSASVPATPSGNHPAIPASDAGHGAAFEGQAAGVANPQILAVDFQVGADSYEASFKSLHVALQANTVPVEGHYILPKETPKPEMWINLTLKGEAARPPALLLRSDNVYLLGFIAADGTAFCTKGKKKIFPVDCTELPFEDNYGGLTNRREKEDLNGLLEAVSLGKSEAQAAADALARFKHGTTSPEVARKSLLAFTLMIPEAQRFHSIGNKMKTDWIKSSHLTEDQVKLIFVWRVLSALWCRGDNPPDGEWSKAKDKLKALNIKSRADVSRALDMVKNEGRCSDLRKEKPPA
ncbi:hypothetical protein CFC21_064110 [Triticum aestivum]|uniref:rRNA N-glycosylase n=2 Tax=Triticum aestivum TaxID=4565 RepID=A0A9R1H2H2_WHEAT|nr:uncharacterized protein LOC119296907 [Triticum dicoccoides]KAF7056731.1 hypothetical protein CFC21_064110 [Triticum aestivum]